MKKIITIAIACLLSQVSLHAKTLEFLNKLDIPIKFVIGSRQRSPNLAESMRTIEPGKAYKEEVYNTNFPRLLFINPKAPDIGFLYEFRDKKDPSKPLNNNIYVRLVDNNGKISFEPQVNILWPNLSKENIFLVGTPSVTKAGNKPTAPESEEVAFQKLITIIKTTNKDNRAQQLKVFQELLQQYPQIINKKYVASKNAKYNTHAEETPLIIALRDGQQEIATLLIDAGADVNIVRGSNTSPLSSMSPLIEAVDKGNLDMIQRLVAAKADLNYKAKSITGDYSTALSRASYNGYKEIVEWLLKAGANPSTLELNKAIQAGQLAIAKLLIAAGAKLDSNSLLTAVSVNPYDKNLAPNPDIVKLLIASGANPNDTSPFDKGQTILMVAAQAKKDTPEIIKLLIAAGADINAEDTRGLTALAHAVREGNMEIARYLLDAGSKTTVTSTMVTGKRRDKPLENMGEYLSSNFRDQYIKILAEHNVRKEQAKPATKTSTKVTA